MIVVWRHNEMVQEYHDCISEKVAVWLGVFFVFEILLVYFETKSRIEESEIW